MDNVRPTRYDFQRRPIRLVIVQRLLVGTIPIVEYFPRSWIAALGCGASPGTNKMLPRASIADNALNPLLLNSSFLAGLVSAITHGNTPKDILPTAHISDYPADLRLSRSTPSGLLLLISS